MAGIPVRFAVTVKISSRYMATGSEIFSPILKAGAGVVADSVPESEDAECQAKAMAVLNAVAVANSLVSNSA